MIKLGHAWVDMNAVSAICENRGESGWSLFLSSGRIVGLTDVTEEEVVQALERCGMIEETPTAIDIYNLTAGELEELAEAARDGFLWAAQDKDGKSFAYPVSPVKRSSTWMGNGSGFRRLKAGDYGALSFDQDAPLDLAELFGLEVDDD